MHNVKSIHMTNNHDARFIHKNKKTLDEGVSSSLV